MIASPVYTIRELETKLMGEEYSAAGWHHLYVQDAAYVFARLIFEFPRRAYTLDSVNSQLSAQVTKLGPKIFPFENSCHKANRSHFS